MGIPTWKTRFGTPFHDFLQGANQRLQVGIWRTDKTFGFVQKSGIWGHPFVVKRPGGHPEVENQRSLKAFFFGKKENDK